MSTGETKRHVLVIASQCDALNSPLDGLGECAKDLYKVMVDPNIGQCVSALGEEPGLLLDQKLNETKGALELAFQQAGKANALLIISFIGHGEFIADDYYFRTFESTGEADQDYSLAIVQKINALSE